MNRTTSEKMGIKENSRTYFQNVPVDFNKTIQSPNLNISMTLDGKFDYIHAFVILKIELEESIKELKPYLSERGHFWVSWPKSKNLETDLNLPTVIEVIYQNGLVESKVVSIDSTWSAIKVTRPIEGKVYKNSYGFLCKDK